MDAWVWKTYNSENPPSADNNQTLLMYLYIVLQYMWLFLNKEIRVCTSNRYETKAQVWEISAAVVSPVCYYGERMFLIYLYSGAQPLHLFMRNLCIQGRAVIFCEKCVLSKNALASAQLNVFSLRDLIAPFIFLQAWLLLL